MEEEEEGKSDKIEERSNKGKGLKKWKRIQRTTINPAAAAAKEEEEDLHRVLKRDSRRFAVPYTHTHTSGGGGGDSDNSEGRSSTAASAPTSTTTKYRSHHHHHHHHRTGGTGSVHRPTTNNNQKKKIEESSKKLRGGDNDRDRDVSYSSVESSFFSSNGVGGGGRIHDQDQDEQSSSDSAPPATLLSDAIISLHALHHALLKEIQSFGEIGKEAVVLKADELVFEEEVKGKERELLREEWKWRETEQEFAHKVEAEVQYLVIREKLKDHNKSKSTALVLHTEDEDPLKLRSAVSKYGLLLCVQFIILFVVLLQLLFLQLWPGSTGFVPT